MLLPPIPVPVRTAPQPRDSFEPDTASPSSQSRSEGVKKTSSKSDDRDKDDKQKPVDNDQNFTQLLAVLINGTTTPEPKPAATEESAQTTTTTTDQNGAATSAEVDTASDAAKTLAITQNTPTTIPNSGPATAGDASQHAESNAAVAHPTETVPSPAATQQVTAQKQDVTTQEPPQPATSPNEKPVQQQKTEPTQVVAQATQNAITSQEESTKGEQSQNTEPKTTESKPTEQHAPASAAEKAPLRTSEPPLAPSVQNASALQDIGTDDVPKSEKATGKRTAPMEATTVNVPSADAAATTANPVLVAAATTDAKAAVATTPGISAPTAAHVSAQVAQVLMGRDADLQAGQSKSFEMMLDPPELGRLFIQMSRGNRGLEVRISAEDDRVGALLQSGASDLQQSLQLSNLSLGQFGTNSQQTPNEAFRDLVDASGSDSPINPAASRSAAPAFVRPRAGASALNVVV